MSDKDLTQKSVVQLRRIHHQVCFENGDHPDEIDTPYSLGADALERMEALSAASEHASRNREKVTIEEAQSHIDGLKVAEIIRDAQVEFRDEYPDHVLALGVGPIQTMLGLAIKNGHITVKNKN
jgi:hypothetical protein